MRNREIYKEAKSLGICKEWAARLKNASEKQMAKMFFTGSDWAFENNFPTKEILRSHPNVMDYGLHLDAEKETYKGIERLAFFGDSKANLIYDNFEVAEVYVRHNSIIGIVVSGGAIVNVSLADNAKVNVINQGGKVYVISYSDMAEINGNPTKIRYGRRG